MQKKMKTMAATFLGLVLVGSISTSRPIIRDAKAQSADAPTSSVCTNATVQGSYGFQRNGTTSKGALTAVGLGEFDGQGNATGQQEISRSGVFSFLPAIAGTYTINPDCTGTLFDPTGNPFAYLVVTHNGSEILGMSLTAGNNVAIHYERINDLPGNSAAGHEHGK